jgi:hypothetical protein
MRDLFSFFKVSNGLQRLIEDTEANELRKARQTSWLISSYERVKFHVKHSISHRIMPGNNKITHKQTEYSCNASICTLLYLI